MYAPRFTLYIYHFTLPMFDCKVYSRFAGRYESISYYIKKRGANLCTHLVLHFTFITLHFLFHAFLPHNLYPLPHIACIN